MRGDGRKEKKLEEGSSISRKTDLISLVKGVTQDPAKEQCKDFKSAFKGTSPQGEG